LKKCDGVRDIVEIHREWLLPFEASNISSPKTFGETWMTAADNTPPNLLADVQDSFHR
jgi:hypothetical protein